MMPIAIETDSSTLQLIYLDFLYDLNLTTSRNQQQASLSPTLWIDNYNKVDVFAPRNRLELVNIHQLQQSIQATKIYFKQFILHPMKIVLTFTQSPLPRNRLVATDMTLHSTLTNILTTLAGIYTTVTMTISVYNTHLLYM